MNKTTDDRGHKVREYQRQTTGSESLTWHWTKSISFTDGIRYVADVCQAWWLVDLVASHQPEIKRRTEFHSFQLWVLTYREPSTDFLIQAWSDTPGVGELLAEQEIPLSDFPLDLCPDEGFQFYVENEVMMLKEER